jgi:hypothetical protein
MKFWHFGLSLLLIYFSTSIADAQVVVGQTHGIHSAVLKEERKYRVYLPDSYAWAKDRRYPVLYLLDAESQFLHTAASVDYLASHGEIPELIVVGLDSTVRVRDFSPTGLARSMGWRRGAAISNASCPLSSFRPSSERTVQTGSECFRGILQVGCLLCIAWPLNIAFSRIFGLVKPRLGPQLAATVAGESVRIDAQVGRVPLCRPVR